MQEERTDLIPEETPPKTIVQSAKDFMNGVLSPLKGKDVGQMVEEFDAFCFDNHKPGDTAIVYGEGADYAGYHVMYYVGEGELYSDHIARGELSSEAITAWLDELTAGYEAVHASGYKRVG